MHRKLNGRVALVIGAGSRGEGWGTGKAIAVQLARAGAAVAAVDQNERAARETVGIITAEGARGVPLVADVADVLDPAQVEATVGATMREFGRIDILVSNVGAGGFGNAVEVSLDSWRRDLDLNLTYALLTCKAVLPIMVAQRGGPIINISAIAALKVSPWAQYGYSAAKAALNQLTRLIAVDFAPYGIRCNAILPGILDTPLARRQQAMIDMAGGTWELLAEKRAATSPTGTQGTAWDVAAAAAFLASPEADYVNGVLLPVDGGVVAR